MTVCVSGLQCDSNQCSRTLSFVCSYNCANKVYAEHILVLCQANQPAFNHFLWQAVAVVIVQFQTRCGSTATVLLTVMESAMFVRLQLMDLAIADLLHNSWFVNIS